MKDSLNYPLPDNEEARLLALKQCAILDTLPEKSFDDIAKLAAQICGVDKSMVSFIDETRKWHKAKHNIAPIEVPRGFAICSRTILNAEPLIVPDTLKNPDTKTIDIVCNPPHLRFYAGVPLLTKDNLALGTLCVVDTEPRSIDSQQVVALEQLAQQIMQLLELHVSIIKLKKDKLELKRLNKQLEYISETDELTSLRNRRSFNTIALAEVAHSNDTDKPLSLMLIDIDHFKQFNDVHGHAFGDKVLAQVGTILNAQTSEKHYCARYGGEEFIILLPETLLAEAIQLAEEYRQSVSATKFHGEDIRVSIGVAELQFGETYDSLFKHADAALFRAKAEGRDCTRFSINQET